MLNGFAGYKFGYENIVYDTVDYVNDQIDLMHRFKQYIEDNPIPLTSYVEPLKNENGATSFRHKRKERRYRKKQ